MLYVFTVVACQVLGGYVTDLLFRSLSPKSTMRLWLALYHRYRRRSSDDGPYANCYACISLDLLRLPDSCLDSNRWPDPSYSTSRLLHAYSCKTIFDRNDNCYEITTGRIFMLLLHLVLFSLQRSPTINQTRAGPYPRGCHFHYYEPNSERLP